LQQLAVTSLLAAGLTILAAHATQAQTSSPPNKAAFGPRLQKGAQKGPVPETIGTFDDWKVQCETPRPRKAANAKDTTSDGSADPSGKSDSETLTDAPQVSAAETPKRVCGMVQTTRSEKVPQIGLSLFIARAKQGEKMLTQMRLLAPIGVYLPTGVALEIDGTAVSRVPFSRCLPQFCVALGEASPETLEKMIRGEAANFILYQGPGAGLPMRISLKGFGKALEVLDSQ
jgi:invasion protein IalB